MDKSDIVSACDKIRESNVPIPEEVLEFMVKSSVEKMEISSRIKHKYAIFSARLFAVAEKMKANVDPDEAKELSTEKYMLIGVLRCLMSI